MRTLTVRAIDVFTDWFGSVGCVIETLVFCALIAGLEAAFPGADPHNFKFLYAMTFYSSVTQPALAYAAARSTRASQRATDETHNALEILQAQDKTQADVLRAILVLLDKHEETASR